MHSQYVDVSDFVAEFDRREALNNDNDDDVDVTLNDGADEERE